MTTALEHEKTRGDFAPSTRLRRADSSARHAPIRTAGPFEPVAATRKGPHLRDTLMTALLVVYPAFATVTAIVVGLVMAGGGA